MTGLFSSVTSLVEYPFFKVPGLYVCVPKTAILSCVWTVFMVYVLYVGLEFECWFLLCCNLLKIVSSNVGYFYFVNFLRQVHEKVALFLQVNK